MAVRFKAATDFYAIVTAPPTTYTITCWAKIAVNRTDFSPALVVYDGVRSLWVETGATGLVWGADSDTTRVGNYTTTVGAWTRLAVSVTGTTVTFYGGAPTGTFTVSSGTITDLPTTPTEFDVGGDSTTFLNGSVAGVKLYNRVLTLDEITAELTQIVPVSTRGLWAAYPLDSHNVEGRVDFSGSGRMLAAGSTTAATEDGPPIPRQKLLIRPWRIPPAGSALPGVAPATGTAAAPTVAITAPAGVATATGAAIAPAGSIAVPTGVAVGTGAANQASTTTPQVPAGLAAGTGTAADPAIATSVTTAIATATGAALSAPATIQAATGPGAAAAAANPPTTTISSNIPAGLAAGIGTARSPGIFELAGVAAAIGAAYPAAATTEQFLAPGFTRIHPTIRPTSTLDVDAAELESLTRQGLIVGTPAAAHTTTADVVITYVSTTIDPDVTVGVGAAELESLTRQRLIFHNFGWPMHAGAATAAGVARAPVLAHPASAGNSAAVGIANPPTVRVSVFAGAATGTGAAPTPGGVNTGFYALWATLTADPTRNLWAIQHATTTAQVSAFAQLIEG